MRRIRFLLTLLIVFFDTGCLSAQSCKEIVGYYASWKWYKRDKLVNPVSIDYSRYTILNYAFFKPLPAGNITEGDKWADQNILLGKVITQNGLTGHDASTSLISNSHKHNVKVVASIGGWNWSSAFPAIAADAEKRKLFAQSCVLLIRKYNFDGIDIDWEFPGNKLHNGTYGDKSNFTLLLREIRNSLSDYGHQTGNNYLLTAAFGPAPEHLANIEWEEVAPLLDMIHVMTYNYYGAWDKITNHNTPLNPAVIGNPAFAISSTITRLTEYYRVPASKITMGIAFYGRSSRMPGIPLLFEPSLGIADDLTFPEENGTPSYYNIMAKSSLFSRQWDSTAGVPYLTGKSGLNSFVSYDDPESIRIKARYAQKMHLHGVVIWDISGDYMETYPGSGKIAGTPLANVIRDVFYENREVVLEEHKACSVDLLAYPNPFRDEVDLSWKCDCEILTLEVRNQSGQLFYTRDKISGCSLKIVTSGWTVGWYIIQMMSSSGISVQKVLKL